MGKPVRDQQRGSLHAGQQNHRNRGCRLRIGRRDQPSRKPAHGQSEPELATYDPRRLTGISVYQEIEREFSIGDRIQFTAPDKSLGIANRDLAAIEAIPMVDFPSASTMTARLNSMTTSIVISTTAMPSPVTAPGPYRRTRPGSRWSYQRPPGPPQLPIRLRLYLREPRGHALH